MRPKLLITQDSSLIYALRLRFVQELKRVPPPFAPQGKILSQWVALIIVIRHENTEQVRMVAEPAAHHVIDLALHEICAFPEVRQRGDLAIRFVSTSHEPDAIGLA